MSSRAPRPSWVTLPPLDEPPATLLDGLAARFPRISRTTWQRRLADGLVSDGQGNAFEVDAPYVAHQRVAYFRELAEEPLPMTPIDIVYMDEHLVVADKPPFLPVTPGGRFVRNCLLYLLEEQLGEDGLAPIHRLDRATSGLVMLARQVATRGAFGQIFESGQIERHYVAVARVPERPTESRWRLASRIVQGTPFFRMREADGEANAVTEIELDHWHDGWGRFLLRPESGKTHQLRLHMARLGWPIEGDRLYPALLPEAPDDPQNPLRLVAQRLRFVHPVNGHRMDLILPDTLGYPAQGASRRNRATDGVSHQRRDT